MPVSLSEWRVRIGTFVHWIREYEVKERRERLLKERIRRLKVLCERLEAKRGDSGEESEDDKSRQDGTDPKGCPHKTVNIRSSGNSSDIKDLLTSCDQCIQDLLTASDSHIKEILTPSGSSIKELITPNDCSIRSLNSLNGPTIKDIITPNESGIKELVSTNDSRIKNLVKANDDSRIQDLVKANDDSRIQDLLTTNYSSTCIRDLITTRYCSIKDVIVSKHADSQALDTPNDSSPKELTSLNASSIKDLITPNDSSIIDLITSEYSNVKELITSNDSKIDRLLSPNKTNIKRIIQPDDDYIEEQFARTCTSDDQSIQQDTQVGDSEEQHMSEISISTRHSLSDASVMELLTSSNPSTKDLQTPTDDLNADLIIKTSNIKDHETQSDCSVKELPSPGTGTTLCRPFAPCDDLLVELLKPTASPSKDLPSIDLCCHEPGRQNESFSEESHKLPHIVGKDQHPQPDTFTEEATDDEVLKEHHISSGSCKKSQTETSILMAVECSPVVVPFISRKYCISERYGEKQMGESASSCHGPSLKSKTDLISGQIPPLSELLLLKSGDVELNPGPREAAGWSMDFERELLLLVKEVSAVHYHDLCNALDVSYAQSKVILTKNLLDVSKSLFEAICSWGVKQRDGTNYKRLLAEKLKSVHLDELETKLVEGGYSTQDTPTQSLVADKVQRVNKLTQEEVIRCGKDLRTFYRTEMCKIKTDPLDFDSIKEFENIYTNLVLLRNEMGTKIKTQLEYNDLFTKRINGELPKRLLVEGEGGSGKTTYCSKIAWDWANGYKAYEHLDWVIVIPMQEIQNCKTVGDIVKTYLSDSNMVQPRQINDYILSEPSKVLIILDGLNEYSRDILNDESDFGKIIRSEKFKECIILITSRPWKANPIKSHRRLRKIYTFISVEGFSSENVSSYINRYFVDDNMAGADLIKFMEDSNVIKMTMAPFPIYVAMLCILWRESTKERREVIRRLKTFSQLVHQMITFLKEHFISKSYSTLTEHLHFDTKIINKYIIEIGKIAFFGLLDQRLIFNENDFSLCKEAMDVCSKIGILSQEKQFVRRFERAGTKVQSVTFNIFFSHKLFQEYVAALYLASLYESKDAEYKTSINKILMENLDEFRYLIYFTSSQGKGVGLDIINRLDCGDDFLVDVAFEAYDADCGKVVGQRILRKQKSMEIGYRMSAHTLSGYLFITEQQTMAQIQAFEHFEVNNLNLRDDQTASYCLGKFLSLLPHLTDLKICSCSLHDDFYKEIADRASSSRIQTLKLYDLNLRDDPSASYCLGKFLSLLPHLSDLKIHSCSLHDDFYKEIAVRASSSRSLLIKEALKTGKDSPIKEESEKPVKSVDGDEMSLLLEEALKIGKDSPEEEKEKPIKSVDDDEMVNGFGYTEELGTNLLDTNVLTINVNAPDRMKYEDITAFPEEQEQELQYHPEPAEKQRNHPPITSWAWDADQDTTILDLQQSNLPLKEVFSFVAQSCPKLRTLRLHANVPVLISEESVLIESDSPMSVDESDEKDSPKIKIYMRCRQTTDVPFRALLAIVSSIFPKISDLTLDGDDQTKLDISGYMQPLPSSFLPKLHKLCLVQFMGSLCLLTLLKFVIEQLSNLPFLRISQCNVNVQTESKMEFSISGLSRLEIIPVNVIPFACLNELVFKAFKSITNFIVQNIATEHQIYVRLNWTKTGQMPTEKLYLKQSTPLKAFKDLLTIVKKFPRISKLETDECGSLDRTEMLEIVKTCTQLQYFSSVASGVSRILAISDQFMRKPTSKPISKSFGKLGGELRLETHNITLCVPKGAIREEREIEIGLQALTDPPSTHFQEDEMVCSFGFQCTIANSPRFRFAVPVKVTLPHSAILDDPLKVGIGIYHGELWHDTGDVEISTITYIPPSENRLPRCEVDEKEITVFIDHFSFEWPVVNFWNPFVRGKRLGCLSFVPKGMPPTKKPILRVHLFDNVKGNPKEITEEESECDFRKTHPKKELKARANLDVTYGMDGSNNHDNKPEVTMRTILFSDIRQLIHNTVDFRLDFSQRVEQFASVNLSLTEGTRNRGNLSFDVDFTAGGVSGSSQGAMAVEGSASYSTSQLVMADILTDEFMLKLSKKIDPNMVTAADFSIYLGLSRATGGCAAIQANVVMNQREAFKDLLSEYVLSNGRKSESALNLRKKFLKNGMKEYADVIDAELKKFNIPVPSDEDSH